MVTLRMEYTFEEYLIEDWLDYIGESDEYFDDHVTEFVQWALGFDPEDVVVL